MTLQTEDLFDLRLAETEQDILGAQRLRYRVFVEELGGDGTLVDHTNRLERDDFDDYYDHLILVDTTRDAAALDHVVGVYRLMPGDRVAQAGRFYTSDEYDLSVLEQGGRRLLELGRSCVHPDYRGGRALLKLWTGLGAYVQRHQIEILFGVASFHGTDVQALAQPLSFLHQRHLAPPELRVRAQEGHYASMDILPVAQIDRPLAARMIPPLLKSYLRLGGYVGDGAFVDRPFNTTDVCLVMDVTKISAAQRAMYTGSLG